MPPGSPGGGNTSHVVGIARVLDLDHCRPEVGEHLVQYGPARTRRHVEDDHAVQRQQAARIGRLAGRARSACRAAPAHQPPRASQSSSCSSRSEPQNGSPSTKTNGEPKTPRSSEAATASRRSVRASSLSTPAHRARLRRAPRGDGERADLVAARRGRGRGASSGRTRRARRRLPARRDGASPSRTPVPPGAGPSSGRSPCAPSRMPWRRMVARDVVAARSRPFSGVSSRGFRPITFITATPSSMQCQRTLRPWRAAIASMRRLAK